VLHGASLTAVPKPLWADEEIVLATVKHMPEDLKLSPLRDSKVFVCKALLANAEVLQYLAYRDDETYKLAVTADPFQLRNVPCHLITEELSRLAVMGDWRAIQFVPDIYQGRVGTTVAIQWEEGEDQLTYRLGLVGTEGVVTKEMENRSGEEVQRHLEGLLGNAVILVSGTRPLPPAVRPYPQYACMMAFWYGRKLPPLDVVMMREPVEPPTKSRRLW
jgi:hypothetical protein